MPTSVMFCSGNRLFCCFMRAAVIEPAVIQPGLTAASVHAKLQVSLVATGPAARPLGLKERVVAIESLTAIADTLKAAKAALLVQLGGKGLSKDVEGYFSRTVDAAQDLRDAIYKGGAKQLLSVRKEQPVRLQERTVASPSTKKNSGLASLQRCSCQLFSVCSSLLVLMCVCDRVPQGGCDVMICDGSCCFGLMYNSPCCFCCRVWLILTGAQLHRFWLATTGLMSPLPATNLGQRL